MNTTISKIKLLLAALVLSINVCAQNGIKDMNQQLRNMFGSIPHPANVNFCYDMACHIVDSCFYSTDCHVPTNSDTWFYMKKCIMQRLIRQI